jgi:hypothetical protein
VRASILDAHMPRWHFRERHRRLIATTPQRTIELVADLRGSELPITGALMGLRLLGRRRSAPDAERPIFPGGGFVSLGHEETEVAFGVIGKFWRPRPLVEQLSDADEFDRFDRPGFAKAAVNFSAEAVGDGAMLSTETRILALDWRARLAFLPYWVLVRLGGELIRREMLSAVARRAAAA